MRQAMQKAKLPDPRFRQIEALSHQVHVTLENNIAAKGYDVLSPARAINRSIGLSSDEVKIMEYLKTRSDLNITHAALIIDKSWPTASKAVNSLIEKGLIVPVKIKTSKHDPGKKYKLNYER